eukprot:2235129-Rhodomonas_salina.7
MKSYWTPTRLNTSWITVELLTSVADICESLGAILHTETFALSGIQSTNPELLRCVRLSISLFGTHPRAVSAAVR